jgi:hypothetical protein
MVEFKLSDIKETKPIELGVRFLFGGLCTVGAGLIARRYGPAIGGLFPRISCNLPRECHPHPSSRKEKEGTDQLGWYAPVSGCLQASMLPGPP